MRSLQFLSFIGAAQAAALARRDNIISSSFKDAAANLPFGKANELTTVKSGITVWLSGGGSHPFQGNINNYGTIVCSQTDHLKENPSTIGQISNQIGASTASGNLVNKGVISINDFGASSGSSYDWSLHSLENRGSLQFCGNGKDDGSNFQLSCDSDCYNYGVIDFEQYADNHGSSCWKNKFGSLNPLQKIYNEGAFRLLNVVHHNVQNVFGAGCWIIDEGAALYLEDGTGAAIGSASALANQKIFFSDAASIAGKLQTIHLDSGVYASNSDFGPQIFGFGVGKALEFTQSIRSFSYSNGILQVVFTSNSRVNIKLGPGYDASQFFQGLNPSSYNTKGFNAIFYRGACPLQKLPPVCEVALEKCGNPETTVTPIPVTSTTKPATSSSIKSSAIATTPTAITTPITTSSKVSFSTPTIPSVQSSYTPLTTPSSSFPFTTPTTKSTGSFSSITGPSGTGPSAPSGPFSTGPSSPSGSFPGGPSSPSVPLSSGPSFSTVPFSGGASSPSGFSSTKPSSIGPFSSGASPPASSSSTTPTTVSPAAPTSGTPTSVPATASTKSVAGTSSVPATTSVAAGNGPCAYGAQPATTYTASNGDVYGVCLNTDFPGDNIAVVSNVPDVNSCAETCSKTPGCIEGSLQKASNTCYLKSAPTYADSNNGVDSVYKISGPATSTSKTNTAPTSPAGTTASSVSSVASISSTSPSSATTTAVSSYPTNSATVPATSSVGLTTSPVTSGAGTSAPSTTITTAKPVGNGPCANGAGPDRMYTTPDGDVYGVCLKTDFPGGNLDNVAPVSGVTTPEQCADACSHTAGCVAGDLVQAGPCYLKATLTPGSSNDNVDSVYKISSGTPVYTTPAGPTTASTPSGPSTTSQSVPATGSPSSGAPTSSPAASTGAPTSGSPTSGSSTVTISTSSSASTSGQSSQSGPGTSATSGASSSGPSTGPGTSSPTAGTQQTSAAGTVSVPITGSGTGSITTTASTGVPTTGQSTSVKSVNTSSASNSASSGSSSTSSPSQSVSTTVSGPVASSNPASSTTSGPATTSPAANGPCANGAGPDATVRASNGDLYGVCYNTDFQGGDVSNQGGITSPKDLAEACSNTPNCIAGSVIRSNGEGYLKSVQNPATYNSGVDSVYKISGEQPNSIPTTTSKPALSTGFCPATCRETVTVTVTATPTSH